MRQFQDDFVGVVFNDFVGELLIVNESVYGVVEMQVVDRKLISVLAVVILAVLHPVREREENGGFEGISILLKTRFIRADSIDDIHTVERQLLQAASQVGIYLCHQFTVRQMQVVEQGVFVFCFFKVPHLI